MVDLQERPHVPYERTTWTRCWFGSWKGDGAAGEGTEKGLIVILNERFYFIFVKYE